MTFIHMIVGIPGSGKSTFSRILAKELGIDIISSDDMRNKNPGLDEPAIWDKIYETCTSYCIAGKDFIFDATNITPKVRKRFMDKMKEKTNDFEIGAYFIPADPDLCHERCIKRNEDKNERYLPPELVYSYAKELVVPDVSEGFKFVKVISCKEEYMK